VYRERAAETRFQEGGTREKQQARLTVTRLRACRAIPRHVTHLPALVTLHRPQHIRNTTTTTTTTTATTNAYFALVGVVAQPAAFLGMIDVLGLLGLSGSTRMGRTCAVKEMLTAGVRQ
jgi:hypothetical protein